MSEDNNKPSIVPEFQNPARLNPVLALAKTARDLNISYNSREKERVRQQAVDELVTLPRLCAPKP